MNIKRVAYILTPIDFGGAEKVSLNFLRTVDRNRFDILPILLVRPWEEPPHFAREIHRLDYRYETVPVARDRSADPWRVPRVAKRLYSILKREAVDLVHTNGYFADICGLPAAGCLRIKKLATCHGFIDGDQKLKYYNYLDKRAIRFCQRVIVVSDQLKSELVGSGVRASRIQVIPNAVAAGGDGAQRRLARKEKRRLAGIPDGAFVVGYTGRLSAEKGVRYLVEAVARLNGQGTAVRLLIIGAGGEMQELQNLVRQQGLEDRTVFTGFQTDSEAWISCLDVLTLPSLTEGTPMTLLEGMSLGVPVIASAVGGVPDVVRDGVNGFLVAPGDVEGLSRKILAIMQKQVAVDEVVAQGMQTINSNYGMANWCQKIESVYEGIEGVG